MDINEAKVVRYEREGEGGATLIYYYEIAGDSSETKPTDAVADGSIFTETDTGDVYIYNAKGGEWNKMFGLSGGGGAGQNKKSVITGTLATFADDFAEFFGITGRSEAAGLEAKFKAGDYHAVLSVDGTAIGSDTSNMAFYPDYDPNDIPYGAWFSYGFFFDSNGVLSTGAVLRYDYDYSNPLECWMYQNGDGTNPIDIMQYAENIPYELTVYYHPMS